MPRIFRQELIVTADATDEFGHVNNQRYIAWMQEVATAHSAANGWPMERYLGIGAAWVVRSHFIEYLRPAFAGDAIEIYTWAASLALREVSRKYLFRRAGTDPGTRRDQVGLCRHQERPPEAHPGGIARLVRGGAGG